MKRYLFIVLAGCCLAAGCRKIELVNPTEYEVLPFGENPDADPIGMYLLNEGNMGRNTADIDYLDYRTEVYAEARTRLSNGFLYWFDDAEIEELHRGNAAFHVQTIEYEMLLKGFEKPCLLYTSTGGLSATRR